jgi:hypothetical protein
VGTVTVPARDSFVFRNVFLREHIEQRGTSWAQLQSLLRTVSYSELCKSVCRRERSVHLLRDVKHWHDLWPIFGKNAGGSRRGLFMRLSRIRFEELKKHMNEQ